MTIDGFKLGRALGDQAFDRGVWRSAVVVSSDQGEHEVRAGQTTICRFWNGKLAREVSRGWNASELDR